MRAHIRRDREAVMAIEAATERCIRRDVLLLHLPSQRSSLLHSDLQRHARERRAVLINRQAAAEAR